MGGKRPRPKKNEEWRMEKGARIELPLQAEGELLTDMTDRPEDKYQNF